MSQELPSDRTTPTDPQRNHLQGRPVPDEPESLASKIRQYVAGYLEQPEADDEVAAVTGVAGDALPESWDEPDLTTR